MQSSFKLKSSFFLITFCVSSITCVIAQDDEQDTVKTIPTSTKKLHMGLFIGTYFANKFSANMYDGYGFTTNGIKNDFTNSFINRYLNYYGGRSSNPGSANTNTLSGNDLVAQTLGVSPGAWSFSQSDMPYEVSYNMTYLVGFNGSYNINKTSAIILNVNGTKLTVNGKFTIATTGSVTGSTALTNIRQETITGGEQRLMFQLGYQKILGDNDKINFFAEGGINVVMAKYLKNQLLIQNNTAGGAPLIIDLTAIYSQSDYNYYRSKLTGVSVGIFAGLGINLTIDPKYTIQVLYNPSYDKINIGDSPAYKLQHGFGLRFYYNI